MSHTHEPWPEPLQTVKNINEDVKECFTILDQDGIFEKEADAQRAVTCVNACAGMSDPSKEIQSMRDTIKGYEDVLHEISQQKSCRHSELQKGLTCLELKSEQLDTYCAYCLAAHTLKNL